MRKAPTLHYYYVSTLHCIIVRSCMKGTRIENYWLYHLANINTLCGTQVTTGLDICCLCTAGPLLLLNLRCYLDMCDLPLNSGHADFEGQ